MDKYAPNSNLSKERKNEESRVKRKVKGRLKSKSNTSALLSQFIVNDIQTAVRNTVKDVLIPKTIDVIVDVSKSALDMIFYGSEQPTKKSKTPRVSYSRYYEEDRNRPRERSTRFAVNTIEFDSKAEAEDALAQLDDIIREYQILRVADFYDVVDVSSEPIDYKYGWTNIQSAFISNNRGHWYINLPRVMPISNDY